MLLWLLTIWFASGLLTGLTSFGGNLLAIPLTALFIPARSAVVLSCVAGLGVGVTLSLLYRKDILWGELAYLLAGFAGGMPLGIYFLKASSEKLLLLAAGGCIMAFFIWQWLQPHLKSQGQGSKISLGIALGFICGLMLGSTGMGGPPIAFYAVRRAWTKNQTMGTLNVFFVVFLAFMLPIQWFSGLFAPGLIEESFWCAIFAVLGVLVSFPLARRVNRQTFSKLLLGMIAFSGLMLFIRALAI